MPVRLRHAACKRNLAIRVRQINPTGKSILIFRSHVKPENQKYFARHVGQISGITLRVSPARGASAVVTNVAVRCGGR